MKKEILVVGLGKMGSGIAKRLIYGGFSPYLYNRDYQKTSDIIKIGGKGLKEIEEFRAVKADIKIVWLMLPAGEVTNSYIKLFSEILTSGDIIIDGANSNWKNSVKNFEFLKEKNIDFLDIGVSGGIWGEKNGYCLMVGGDRTVFEKVEEYLKVISSNDSYLYCGESGSGHFIKMVHNAIEYAMMEAYAEGFDMILSFNSIKAKKRDIAKLWNKNSVIRSWLLELLVKALEDDDDLKSIIGKVSDSGEGRWAVEYAVENGIIADVIASSLFRRFRSRIENPFSERVLSALRYQFGGHDFLRNK